MSLTISKILNSIDIFFSKLLNFIFEITLSALCTISTITAITFVLFVPFERNFKFSELDQLESYTVLAFILVTIRFFKRSKLENVFFAGSLKRYFIIATTSVVFYVLLTYPVLLIKLFDNKEIQLKYIKMNMDFIYFTFSSLFIFALYIKAPLPSKEEIKGKLEKKEGETDEAFHEKTDFFTDTKGNTKADAVDIDSVNLEKVDLKSADLEEEANLSR